MKKEYLHLWVYPCEACAGPVVAGSTAVRENEISKETEIQPVGAICLSCGHRQDKATDPERVRHLLPIAWDQAGARGGHAPAAVFVEAPNRAELH